MAKTAYLDALKRAMTGLPPEAQAKTLAYYEQRFVDGVAAGRTEESVAAELDDPKKVAMTLRASIHLANFDNRKNPANFVRMAFAAIGLLIFNLVMVLPAMVYASLLASMYAFGLVAYLYGIIITSSGVTGVNDFTFDRLGQHIQVNDRTVHRDPVSLRVLISGPNMRFFLTEPPAREHQVGTATFTFARELEDATRPVQSFLGVGITLSGILVLLLSVMMTRYTAVGVRRYVDMNLSLLKGH